MTPRDRLALALAPELVDAFEALIAERVDQAVAEMRGPGGGSDWLTLDEGAAYLRVSVRTLERLIARGLLPSTTLGRRRLVNRNDLDALARRGGRRGASANPLHPATAKD